VKDSARHLNTRTPEEEFLKNGLNFKILKTDISSVKIQTSRNAWTGAAKNNGTVEITTGAKTRKYILHFETPAQFLKVFFDNLGCPDVQLVDNSPVKEIEPLSPDEKKVNTKHYKAVKRWIRIFNVLVFISFFWLIFFPVFFEAGALIEILLPVAGVLVSFRYRRFLHNGSKQSHKVTGFLIMPILVPPIILTVSVFINFNVIYRPIFFAILLLITIIGIFLILLFKKEFRNKASVALIAMILVPFLYSGIVATNCIFAPKTIVSYTATIEQKRASGIKMVVFSFWLSPWGPHKSENRFYVSAPVFVKAINESTITIEQNKGLWGIEWYKPAFND
jgi:hypothetical protein